MKRLLINGIAGQMGRALLRALPKWSDRIEIVCGVDCNDPGCDVPVFSDCDSIEKDFDVAIDFSVPNGTMAILAHCVRNKKPIVICTTGLTDRQVRAIEEASKVIPIFRSGNMSLGVHLLLALCRQAERTLAGTYDVEIVETHHNRKIDAPSGTAKMIADAIAGEREEQPAYVFGRRDANRRREAGEIGIHSVRGGTVTGEHEVLFLGEDEAIVLTHRAFSKDVFAQGALHAALFLADKPCGLYDMGDLVSERV